MLRCMHGVGGHVNVHVKCIRCRCFVAYMGWGGMLTFMWSAYGVDATLHGGGHVNVHMKCIQCRCYVGGGMLTFIWSAYGVDATLHTWGGGGHVNVHVKCIRCRCYVAYMACSRALPLDAMRLRLQLYVWMWYWRHRISSEGSDVLERLGALMSKVNDALGYWK